MYKIMSEILSQGLLFETRLIYNYSNVKKVPSTRLQNVLNLKEQFQFSFPRDTP